EALRRGAAELNKCRCWPGERHLLAPLARSLISQTAFVVAIAAPLASSRLHDAASGGVDPDLLGVGPEVEPARMQQHLPEHLIGFVISVQPLEQQPVAAFGFQPDIDFAQLPVLGERLFEAAQTFQRTRVEQACLLWPITGIDTLQALEHLARLLV